MPYSIVTLTQHAANKLTKPVELSYRELKDEFQGTGQLFEDPAFDASYYSCFGSSPNEDYNLEWLRPPELLERYHSRHGSDARMFVDGASKFDLVQGELGDCWLVAAVACLTTRAGMLDQVIPFFAEFCSEDYFGCFAFSLCVDGQWKEVVVDDRLPSRNGHLLYTSSSEKTEFWSAILEKAVAKIFGSYNSLTAGSIEEGLSMLSGGITEKLGLDPNSSPEEIDFKAKKMRNCLARGSLLGCSIPTSEDEGFEVACDNGLLKGHAYSVTGLHEVVIERSEDDSENGVTKRLIRIRNPWGEKEWTGRWSDDSTEWDKLNPRVRDKLHVTNDDGEFYMEFADFGRTFTYVSMCHFQFQEGDDANVNESNWNIQRLDGHWNLATAGGIKGKSFEHNQQYLIKVPEMVDDDECSVVFSLLQMNTRQEEDRKHCIGLVLFEVTGINHPRNTPLGKEFFNDAETFQRPEFNKRREILMRVQLKPGLYCLIPSTLEPKQYGSFVLRAFTEHPIEIETLDYRPRKTLRIDKINISDFATEQEITIMNECLGRFSHVANESNKLYAQNMADVLEVLVSEKFLRHEECITLESCRSYISLVSDNNGPPELTTEDSASFLKLILFIRKAFLAWVKARSDNPGKPPYSLDALYLQQFLAGVEIFLPKTLVGKMASRFMNPHFHASSGSKSKKGEIDFNGLLNIVLRLISALNATKEVKGKSPSDTREKLSQVIGYMLSV
ncbi:calpain-1 catalytic subunit-like isoform X2 [Symsagittifera roscoffensis]